MCRPREDARRLDRALGTGDVLSSFLPRQDDVAVADYFGAAQHLERQAVVIREFALSFVPGILQTERYARAVLGMGYPPLSEAECDRAVDTRLDRARILDARKSPEVWALLDESLLWRPIGGPEIMAEQLRHITALVESGRIRAHIIPFSLGYHPLLENMLTLMWFEDQPPVAYSEGLRMGRLHDSPAVVEALQGRYALALSDALPLRESLALLKATAKGFEEHD